MARPASRVQQGSAAAQSFRRPLQGFGQFIAQLAIIAFDATRATNQNMVGARNTAIANHVMGERAEASLHPVADHGIADFLGNGQAKPLGCDAIIALPYKQHKAGRCHPACRIRGEKIPPFFNGNQADSFLRPRARRLRITARPPTVAIRARKPWRRARTRLLG